jgi:hypothetical protein
MIRSNFRALFVALFLAGTIAGPAALTGCAVLGVQKPENFSERVVAGYKSVTTAADLVGALSAAGKISVADANKALDGAQTAKDGIDAAVALRNAGDFSNAETRLSAVIAALGLIQAQLEARQ